MSIIKYKVTAAPKADGKIELKTQFTGSGDLVDTLARRVIDTEEQAVREALISLGWTPPGPAGLDPEIKHFSDGMTVRDLKVVVRDWPEEGPDGEPCEVWILRAPTTSSPVTKVIPLNMGDDAQSADLLLGCSDAS